MFGDHVGEDVVHKGLKSGWSIAKPKEHDGRLKESKGGDECPFPLVFFLDADVVESPCYDSFFSYVACPLTRFLSLRTILLECLPPKRSFSFTCCVWFLYSVSIYLLRTSFFLHALPQRSLIPSIAQPNLPFISILALVLQTLLGPCATYSPI